MASETKVKPYLFPPNNTIRLFFRNKIAANYLFLFLSTKKSIKFNHLHKQYFGFCNVRSVLFHKVSDVIRVKRYNQSYLI